MKQLHENSFYNNLKMVKDALLGTFWPHGDYPRGLPDQIRDLEKVGASNQVFPTAEERGRVDLEIVEKDIYRSGVTVYRFAGTGHYWVIETRDGINFTGCYADQRGLRNFRKK